MFIPAACIKGLSVLNTRRMSSHSCRFVLELGVHNSCCHHILITLQSRHTLTMVSHFRHSKDEISASQV